MSRFDESRCECPVILLGAGGHASVLLEMLENQSCEISAVVSPEPELGREIFAQYKVIETDEEALSLNPKMFVVVNGIGMLPNNSQRFKVGERFARRGFRFQSVISQNATISRACKLSEGLQIMPGVVVQTGSIVERHVILNTGCVIEHDCHVGPHSHIAPGAILCGGVKVGSNSFVGSGAIVFPGVTIPPGAIVPAGTVVKT